VQRAKHATMLSMPMTPELNIQSLLNLKMMDYN